MDVLDFLLAMNLLARIVYDKKLRCKKWRIIIQFVF
jgi:hypothetical protein